MVTILSVVPLEGHTVRLAFSDGMVRDIDLGPSLNGPVFERIREDRDYFRAIRVDAASGTIVWPNGADLMLTYCAGVWTRRAT